MGERPAGWMIIGYQSIALSVLLLLIFALALCLFSHHISILNTGYLNSIHQRPTKIMKVISSLAVLSTLALSVDAFMPLASRSQSFKQGVVSHQHQAKVCHTDYVRLCALKA